VIQPASVEFTGAVTHSLPARSGPVHRPQKCLDSGARHRRPLRHCSNTCSVTVRKGSKQKTNMKFRQLGLKYFAVFIQLCTLAVPTGGTLMTI
jgi:hypothetical protein